MEIILTLCQHAPVHARHARADMEVFMLKEFPPFKSIFVLIL